MLRSFAVLGLALIASPTARAACTIEILSPIKALPTADKGQWFEFLASSDCTNLVFSANRGAFTKEASFVESTDDGDLYEVRATPMEFGIMTGARTEFATFTWSITGFGVSGEMVRVSQTNELDSDRDGWTRSDGDVGSCDFSRVRNPGAEEICDNGVDDDCDGVVDACLAKSAGTMSRMLVVGHGFARTPRWWARSGRNVRLLLRPPLTLLPEAPCCARSSS